jgi:hypothetical protein
MNRLNPTVSNATSHKPACKVVFVDNYFYTRSSKRFVSPIVPHLGLMSLGAQLELAGHKAEIFDPKIQFGREGWKVPDTKFEAACAANLLNRHADIIGFTAYGRTLPFVLHVARLIRKARPSQIIILGGPHASVLGRQILVAFECFDVVVRHEAEETIVPLVEALHAGAS